MVIQYLENALFTNKVVVLPDFGAFIKEEVMAKADTDVLRPTHTNIRLDTSLKNDYSLLPLLIGEGEQISLSEAEKEVAYFVAEIKSQLERFGEFSVGNLGLLKQNSDGEISFEPEEDSNFSADSYGLPTLNIEDLGLNEVSDKESESANTDHESKETKGKKKGNNLIIWILLFGCVATAALIGVMLTQKQVKDKPSEEESGVVFGRKAKPQHSDAPVSQVEPEEEATQPVTPKQHKTAPTKEKAPTEATHPKQESKPAAKHTEATYNVIIGSFGNPDNAFKLSKSLSGKGLEVIVLDPKETGSKLYMVSVGEFDTDEEAKTFAKEKTKVLNMELVVKKLKAR
jgi:cell division septation protein DedD